MIRVLLIDDDHELARLLREYLAGHGAVLEHAATGAAGLARVRTAGVDAVLLDVMLPGGQDGFAVCRALRAAHPALPVIMLTARGDDGDRIAGLELGADDYVPKPYNPRELLARIHAVLRRSRGGASAAGGGGSGAAAAPAAAKDERLVVGELVVDVPARTATIRGAEAHLTSYEFLLLVALARRAGETVPREQLASAVKGGEGGYDPAIDRSLDVHVSHLRQKLEIDPRDPRIIKTVRGVGYVLARS